MMIRFQQPSEWRLTLYRLDDESWIVLGLPNGKVGPNEGSNRVMLRTHVIVPHVTWKTLFIPGWKRIVVTAAAIIVVFGCYTGNRFTMINTVKG